MRKRGAWWWVGAALGTGCAAGGRVEPAAVAPAAAVASVGEPGERGGPVASGSGSASAASAPAGSGEGTPAEAENAARLAELEGALGRLQGGGKATEGAVCQESYTVAKRLLGEVRLPEGDERLREAPLTLYHAGVSCAARAGDCGLAWRIFVDGFPKESLANLKEESQRLAYVRLSFGSMVLGCKGKAP